MSRLGVLTLTALAAASTLGGCATYCERDTPNLAQPDYGGVARAQEGCDGSARPVRSSQLRDAAR